MRVLAPLCYALIAAFVELLHPLSLEQWHRSWLVIWCTCYWPKKTKISNGPTLICMELYNRVLIIQPGIISSLPGCAKRNLAILQKQVTTFMTCQENHIECIQNVSALATH
jgi:hypothetical protein